MRIALFADIHGNSIALDAVLADIQSLEVGIDAYWVLGDLVAIGHDPISVLERLSNLPNAHFVKGNADRFIVTGERPFPTMEDVKAEPGLLSVFAEVGQSFAWTVGAVASAGWLEWLAGLPSEQRMTLPDRTRMLGVHASPGNDDGTGFHPGLSDSEMQDLLSGCEADLVVVGHTHWPMDIHIGNIHLINPGSVSNSFLPNRHASYAILDANESGYQIQYHQVDYDHEAVITEVKHLRHPGANYIIKFMLGQIRPTWNK